MAGHEVSVRQAQAGEARWPRVRAATWLMAAVLLAGCTSFPGTSQVLGELDVGDLEPGGIAATNVSIDAGWDVLFVGFRTGLMEHVHVVLRAPDGTRYDTATSGTGGCVVRQPAPGTWGLEVAADALDGNLRGGKFTLRGARGEVPPLLGCADDVFPGAGRNVTLAWWHTTLAPGENTTLGFDQPLDLARLEVAVINATANATLTAAPPGAEPVPIAALPAPPPKGRWSIRVEVPATSPTSLLNGTLVVHGWG